MHWQIGGLLRYTSAPGSLGEKHSLQTKHGISRAIHFAPLPMLQLQETGIKVRNSHQGMRHLAGALLLLLAACGNDPEIVAPGTIDAGQNAGDTILPDSGGDAGAEVILADTLGDARTDAESPPDAAPELVQDVDVASEVDAADTATASDVATEDVPTCGSDHCAIGAECLANLSVNPKNPCQRCYAFVDNQGWSADDTAKCDDGSACTPDDHCSGGGCVGTAIQECGDGNLCTVDDCNPKMVGTADGCVHKPVADVSPCDDGNACTTGDVCVKAVCLSGEITTDCDDKDACTTDSCDAKIGCIHTVTGSGPCDDNNACTTGDVCGDKGCMGADITCDDGDVCTVDSCEPKSGCVYDGAIAKFCTDANPCTDEACDKTLGCIYPPHSGSCSDGDPCTVNDTCVNGNCSAEKMKCDDKNVCTADKCDPDFGQCVNLPIDATCDDDDACSVGDACKFGTCYPGEAILECNDGNPCTIDSCDAKTGCTTSPGIGSCNDGNFCTIGDSCSGGGCSGFPLDCDDNNVCTVDSCDPKSGCTYDNAIAKNCTDDNICTDESCDPKLGCVYPFNTASCDDNNVCTISDVCTSGACLGSAIDPNDNNPCTDDFCDKSSGISHVANTLPCDDNDVCTLSDVCADSKCTPGPGKKNCDDGNLCTDDSCDPLEGCMTSPNTLECDDGTVCTTADVCGLGACVGSAISCDDGNACTTDSCDAITGCAHSLVSSHFCRPTIVIDFPPRAATLTGSADITVLGHVTDGAGAITSLTVNGTAVSVGSDGSFSYPMSSGIGGNEIIVVATDTFGSQKQVVQSYLWSTEYYKPDINDKSKGIIDPGLAYYLSKVVIDDGDHSLPANDLATVFEEVLAGFDLNSYIPNPAYNSGGTKVVISNLKYAAPKVVLTPQTGSLHMVATITTITADVKATYPILGFPITVNGKLTADSLVITTDLVPSVDPTSHAAVVTMTNTTVALNNTKVTLNSSFLQAILGGIISGFVNSFVANITNSLVPTLKTSLEPAISSAFNALAFKTKFQVGKLDGSTDKITVDLYNDFNSISVAPDGMIFMLRPRASSATDPAVVNYDELGVPARKHCGDGQPQQVLVTKVGSMELSISDDAFNELLRAVWNGGLLEFPVGPSLLGNIDLSQYGVSDLVMNVDAMLPPVMEDCGYTSPVAQVGDLKVSGSMKLFNSPVDFTMYATFKTDVTVTATNSAIGIALNGVKNADVQVDIVQDSMVGAEGTLAELVKTQVLGALVGKLTGSALGSFPIPAINLSITLPGGGTTSVSLTIATDKVVRDDGNSVVQGHLQ